MPAYVIGASIVTDPAGFWEYQATAGAMLARYGGRLLAAGQAEAVEADYQPDGVAIIEFPSLDQARAWYDSAEYAGLKALRQRSTRSTLLFIDGFPGP
jgi:uncharacterized protein (DUF1330 family)